MRRRYKYMAIVLVVLVIIGAWFLVDWFRTESPFTSCGNAEYPKNANPPFYIIKGFFNDDGSLWAYNITYFRYGVAPHWYEPYQYVKYITSGFSQYFAEGIVPVENFLNSQQLQIGHFEIDR